jgi:hypothetical protein
LFGSILSGAAKDGQKELAGNQKRLRIKSKPIKKGYNLIKGEVIF